MKTNQTAKKYTYTKAEKARIRKMIEVFKDVRRELSTEHSTRCGLCWYVSNADSHYKARIDALDLIDRGLESHSWFHNWVAARNPHLRCALPFGRTMTTLRKQWLNQLIADCEAAL